MPDLMVHFVPNGGRPSWGQTDAAGHYELHYTLKQPGAVAGKHRVFVTPRQPPVLTGPVAPLSAEEEAVAQRYGSLESSPLTASVDRDGQTVDFALD